MTEEWPKAGYAGYDAGPGIRSIMHGPEKTAMAGREKQKLQGPHQRGGGGMWDQPTSRPMHGSRSSGSSGHLMTIGHCGLAVLSCYHFIILPRETLTHQDTQHEGKTLSRGPIRAQWDPKFPQTALTHALFWE